MFVRCFAGRAQDQEAPFAETKIVRCTSGSIYDVMIDLRKDSPTYNQWHGEVLSAENGKLFYIPKGFAHGYKTLEDNTELFYILCLMRSLLRWHKHVPAKQATHQAHRWIRFI